MDNLIGALINSVKKTTEFSVNEDGSIDFKSLMPGIEKFIFSFIKENSDIAESFINILSPAISYNIKEFLCDSFMYTYNLNIATSKKVNQQVLVESMFSVHHNLIELVEKKLSNYLFYFIELNNALIRDKALLYESFGVLGEIKAIEWPVGDFHKKNKSNTLLIFGSGKKIFYKPKQGNNNLFFEQHVKFLQKRGLNIDIKVPKKLVQKNYYWEELHEIKQSNSKKDIERYYYNLGNYLAIFHIIGISDIIYDNIIADKKCPIFIDLECILRPSLNFSDSDPFPNLSQYFQESVVSSGLLPFWTPIGVDKVGNTGGINKITEIFEEEIVLIFREDGLVGRKEIAKKKQNHHLPIFNDKPIAIDNYFPIFERGFNTCMHFYKRHKKPIINEIKELLHKYPVETRILMRHTQVYVSVLRESIHPDLLKAHEPERQKIFLLLNKASDEKNFPSSLIKSEIEQLENCDIPYFHTEPHYKYIVDPNGLTYSILKESGITAAIRRVKELTKEKIKEQKLLIYKSLLCFKEIQNINKEQNAANKKRTIDIEISGATIDKEVIKSILVDLGKDIINRGYKFDNSINWLDISVGRSGHWEMTPKSAGLYDGLDGIAFFYLYLYKVTKRKEFLTICTQIIEKTMVSFNNCKPSSIYHLTSPFNFPISTLYLLWHYNEITEDNRFDLNRIIEEKLIPLVNSLIYHDKYLDVINGSAGLLVFLTDLTKVYKKRALLETIENVYNYIVSKVTISEIGISWVANNFKNIVGFAHGNAGFIFSLAKYYEITRNETTFDLINKAINYNSHFLNKKNGNWLDLRYSKKTEAIPSWCHGSTGINWAYLLTSEIIGINYLKKNSFIKEDEIFNDIISKEDCLCHGTLGNVEIVSAISTFINKPELGDAVESYLYRQLTFNHNKWVTGFTNNQYSLIGLFLGLSGIGYNLMRIFWKDEVPSILALEAPLKYSTYKSIH